jgi:hypothetical protein
MLMKDFCKHEGKKVLLVEGKDDCHVILALCTHFNIPETFGIYECGNDISLLKRLNALILQPDPPETIGIVLDADYPDILNRWQQIQQKIKSHGYMFPKSPLPKGTILQKTEDKPSIGIWVMPDNQKTGKLEDFLMEMVNKAPLQAAEECVSRAKAKGLTTYKPVHHSKAVIHTWLSWQDEPGKPLGQAITANLLKPETDLAQVFINWLKKLFGS